MELSVSCFDRDLTSGARFLFLLFRVVYPATTALLPPSAQVTVLDSNRSEDKEILDWVDNE